MLKIKIERETWPNKKFKMLFFIFLQLPYYLLKLRQKKCLKINVNQKKKNEKINENTYNIKVNF